MNIHDRNFVCMYVFDIGLLDGKQPDLRGSSRKHDGTEVRFNSPSTEPVPAREIDIHVDRVGVV